MKQRYLIFTDKLLRLKRHKFKAIMAYKYFSIYDHQNIIKIRKETRHEQKEIDINYFLYTYELQLNYSFLNEIYLRIN